jgi:hypothetical protein
MVRDESLMLVVLKGSHPFEGEISQDFTYGERETAVHIGKLWAKRGWKPRLLVKSHDGHFSWLTSLLSQQKMAA